MQGGFLPEWIGAAIALAALLSVSYLQLRHLSLALVTVLAPLPGGLLAAWLHAEGLACSYLSGFFITSVLASQVAAKICDGEAAKQAVKAVTRSTLPLLVWPIVLGICISAALPALSHRLPGLVTTAATALSCAAALALLPMARFLAYGGEFVIRANRAREAWDRWLDRLAFVVQPRWGLSVSGIGLIFAMLGLFGAPQGSAPPQFDLRMLLATAVASVVVTYLATRELRRTVAFCLTALVLFCIAHGIGDRFAVSGLWFALGLAMLPVLTMAARSAAFARDCDNAAVATLRSFEMLAVVIAVFCLGAALSLLAFGPAAGAVLVLCGALAALVLLPALTTTIFDLFPPRVSLDAYRVR